MNKIFYAAAICFIIASCDLSKSQSEETQTYNTSNPGTTVPDPAGTTANNSTPVQSSSPVQNVQPQEQATTPATNTSAVKMSIYGTWVLHAYNSTIQDKAEYPRGLPYMTIDSANKKISGFAGCNGIEGTYSIAGNQISISSLTKGDVKCNAQKADDAFMSFFSGKTQGFEFIESFLYFRGTDGKNFTFRKIQ
jgi:heat shock protein HslJ